MTGWREVLALIGPRRAGKTSLAMHLLEMWMAKGGTGEYFDLEALRAPSTPLEMAKCIEKIPKGGLVVLDEIQDWPEGQFQNLCSLSHTGMHGHGEPPP